MGGHTPPTQPRWWWLVSTPPGVLGGHWGGLGRVGLAHRAPRGLNPWAFCHLSSGAPIGTLDQGLVNDPLEGPVYLMGTGLLGSCVLTLSFCVGYLGPAFRTSLGSGTLLVTLKEFLTHGHTTRIGG